MELNRRPRSQEFEALGNRFIIFFWNFGIVPATQTLFLCFHRLKKPTVYTRAHTKKSLYNFLLEFRNCPCYTNSLPLFPSNYKTHCIYASCHDQIFVRSKRPWVDISAVYRFYPWFFSLAPSWNVSELWSQAILSKTQSCEKKYWNYFTYGNKIKT